MKAQQLLKTRSDVYRWMRLAFLLLAVFSLAGFSPSVALADDNGQPRCVSFLGDADGCDRQLGKNAVSDTETPQTFATDDPPSCLDDGNGYLAAIPQTGCGPSDALAFATIADRDGEAFAAFNSRAPPAFG